MKDTMEYNGYIGSVHYDDRDELFHGKLEGIRDLVSYEGSDVSGLKQGFRAAVDEYLETCSAIGKAPDAPYRGTFHVRVRPEIA